MLKGAFVCVLGALVIIVAVLSGGGGTVLLYVSFGLMGFFTLPILPGVT